MAPSLARDWIDWASSKTGPAAALFNGIFNRSSAPPPEDVNPRIYVQGRTQAGVYVDADRGLRQATVWACVTYLSRTIAQLPWHVMQTRPEGGADRMATHPVDWLLNVRPNPEMGSFSFRQTMMGHVLRWGNAYAEIQRDMRGVPLALWIIHPARVRVVRDESGGLLYQVDNYHNDGVELTPSEMFHIRGFGDGPVGLNVIEHAAQTIGWAQATELFGSSFFGEGMNPGGIVETTDALSPEALKVLKQTFRDLYQGPKKAGRTAFLDAGMKWQKVSSNPDEAQFNETRQSQVEDICRWFGVPPHKVQHLLRSTFSNIESQNIEVVVDTLIPWVRVFEDEAVYKLFGQNRTGLFTKMNLNGLLRGDSAARANFYKALRELGVFCVDEIRDLEDMNKIGGELGQARLVPVNMQTLERAVNPPPPPAPAPAPRPSEGNDDDDDSDREPEPGRPRQPRQRLNGHGNGVQSDG
jgi:HK97 family phage portal protein